MTFTSQTQRDLFTGIPCHPSASVSTGPRQLTRLPLKSTAIADDDNSSQPRRRRTRARARCSETTKSLAWSIEEHEHFLEGLELFPRGPWKEIALRVGTRTVRQTMTHAQKYRQKIARHRRGLHADRKSAVSVANSLPLSVMDGGALGGAECGDDAMSDQALVEAFVNGTEALPVKIQTAYPVPESFIVHHEPPLQFQFATPQPSPPTSMPTSPPFPSPLTSLSPSGCTWSDQTLSPSGKARPQLTSMLLHVGAGTGKSFDSSTHSWPVEYQHHWPIQLMAEANATMTSFASPVETLTKTQSPLAGALSTRDFHATDIAQKAEADATAWSADFVAASTAEVYAEPLMPLDEFELGTILDAVYEDFHDDAAFTADAALWRQDGHSRGEVGVQSS